MRYLHHQRATYHISKLVLRNFRAFMHRENKLVHEYLAFIDAFEDEFDNLHPAMFKIGTYIESDCYNLKRKSDNKSNLRELRWSILRQLMIYDHYNERKLGKLEQLGQYEVFNQDQYFYSMNEGEIPLEHFLLDDRQIMFYERLNAVMQRETAPRMDYRVVTEIILYIYQMFPSKIEKMTFFRKFSSGRFMQARRFYTLLFIIYLGIYLIPFFLQITYLEGEQAIKCLKAALAGQIFFMLLELIQISAEKMNYFFNFYNINDVLSFVCFIIYYQQRMDDSASCIP